MAASAPSISSRFTRLVSPAAMRTADFGTFKALATSAITAALAAPSLGAALTRSLRTGRLSASSAQPSTASRPPFGVTRTVSRAGSAKRRRQHAEQPGQEPDLDPVQHQDREDRAEVHAA